MRSLCSYAPVCHSHQSLATFYAGLSSVWDKKNCIPEDYVYTFYATHRAGMIN